MVDAPRRLRRALRPTLPAHRTAAVAGAATGDAGGPHRAHALGKTPLSPSSLWSRCMAAALMLCLSHCMSQGWIGAAAAPPSASHAVLTRWFTRHLAGVFLRAAVDSRRMHHTAQAVGMEQVEQAAYATELPLREEFLEAYCGLMRAYDPPFLLVATAADSQLTVVLLRDVPVLSAFIADLPYLQVRSTRLLLVRGSVTAAILSHAAIVSQGVRVLARPRHEHSFMTFVPEVLCGNPQCVVVLGPPVDRTARHVFRDHEGPRERHFREHVSCAADAMLRERTQAGRGGDSSSEHGAFWHTVDARRDTMDAQWEAAHRVLYTAPHAGRCGGCDAVSYCGSQCQHADWPRHHLVCSGNPSRCSRC